MRLKYVGILLALLALSQGVGAKVREKKRVVSCFIPAEGAPPAEYMAKSGTYANFRSQGYRTSDFSAPILSFTKRPVGFFVEFQEPGALSLSLPKLGKIYDKRKEKYDELKAEGGMASKPVNPEKGLKEYTFYLKLTGDPACANVGSWTFELRVLRSGIWEKIAKFVLDPLTHAPKCSLTGGGLGMSSQTTCTHRVILYTGVPLDRSVQALRLDGLNCNEFTMRSVFFLKYGELPPKAEVPRPGGKGTNMVAAWPLDNLPSTLDPGDELDESSAPDAADPGGDDE